MPLETPRGRRCDSPLSPTAGTDESGESLVKMREDGTASESPKDRYGPFPSMSGWVEWAIPVVGEPRAEDADAKSGLEPAP